MCGIAGYVGKGTQAALEKMSAALIRRGPDDSGFFIAPSVGFAFRRLSIIDVTHGHQPLANEDGSIWAMLNGEIYGYESLREELIRLGHRFSTSSDTEVIVHAYEAWGDGCFERLNGMFGIALWDATRGRLILARDRLGKKPLYWTVKSGTLWFASEIKALLNADATRREIDLLALGAYFRTDAVPTPRSIFKHVQKLEPATAMSWSVVQETVQSEKIWSFWAFPQAQTLTNVQDVLLGLRERIDAAVRERLVSDVPLGLFLSGGIDSAVVAESAARQAPDPLKAFTIGFEDASHDERAAARAVASHLGLKYHETVLSETAALGMLDQAVEILDEPLADPAILPQLFLARFARSEVTVALSGDGGDELLLGYQHVPVHAFFNRHPDLPNFWLKSLGRLLRCLPSSSGYFSFGFKAQRLARGLVSTDPWSRDLAWRGAWTKEDLADLLLPEVKEPAQVEWAEEALAERAREAGVGASFWQAWTWAYLRTYLMDEVLVKVDRATMGFSLEARSPLLDQRVVEYLLAVPEALKLGAWSKKRLFKELLKDRLPASLLDRPKHGFGVPIAAWLSGPLVAKLAELTTSDFLRQQGLFNPQTIQRFIVEHGTKRRDRRKELWALLMFQLWYQRWFDRRERLT